MKYSVTFNVVTAESSEHGDTAEHGFLAKGFTLHDALAEFGPRTNECDGGSIEPNHSDNHRVRWLSRRFSEYVSGEEYEVSLHYPENITPSSRARLTRAISNYI